MQFIKKYWLYTSILIAIIALIITYAVKPALFDFILKPSQRTIYERNFNDNPEKLKRWNNLLSIASKDQVTINESTAERVVTTPQKPFTASYLIDLQLGEVLVSTIASKSSWILEARDLSGDLLQDAQLKNNHLSLNYKPNKNIKVRIILQAKLETESTTDFKIYTLPQYDFPVAGKDNTAIQSFWGASRGGGSRSHEGNDIFASKGHPVVAITYGTISSIRNRGLGGKQVWVKDYDNGYLHYYAHLDDWIVNEGDMVWSGDTLGYVGNTGNAKNTPPHLHFGIYKNGSAVDPKPFIWKTQVPANAISLPQRINPRANGFAANLRTEPSSSSDILQDLKTAPVTIIGNTGNWYHVRTSAGLSGYMHKSVLVEQ
ncbi:peptidoglycan DD-metalloendopeptidase family protein [Nonlabens ulvanivorans]|uniref:peptidoglycan DD-metalloendopeptidase family protein n=1 Tax=Nonlabens ulvanivorans TaxID=906888 RepID=UPI0037C67700